MLPEGRDTVLAVDAVDSGSVTGLSSGARHLVRLDLTAPRDAQLAGGTRRFAAENRYHFFIPVIGCVILAALAGFGFRTRTNSSLPTQDRGRITKEVQSVAR